MAKLVRKEFPRRNNGWVWLVLLAVVFIGMTLVAANAQSAKSATDEETVLNGIMNATALSVYKDECGPLTQDGITAMLLFISTLSDSQLLQVKWARAKWQELHSKDPSTFCAKVRTFVP